MFFIGPSLLLRRYLLSRAQVLAGSSGLRRLRVERMFSGDATDSASVDSASTKLTVETGAPRRSLSSTLRSFFNLGAFGKREAKTVDVVLQSSLVRLYNKCANVDFLRFINAFKMSDTVECWLAITGLHVWFILLRLRQESDLDGFEDLRDDFLDVLWKDVKRRLDLIGRRDRYLTEKSKRDDIARCYSYMTTSMIELDEGIMGDDKALAGALWRLFYKTQRVDDVVALNRLVRYVRQQVHRLNQRSVEDIISAGIPEWEFPSD